MHPVLSAFPSVAFYDGKLVDGVKAEDRPAPEGFEFPKPSLPVAFIDLSAAGSKEQSTTEGSKFNRKEIEVVDKVVRGMLDAGLETKQIGVVTPYSGQVRKLEVSISTKLLSVSEA